MIHMRDKKVPPVKNFSKSTLYVLLAIFGLCGTAGVASIMGSADIGAS